MIPRSFQYFSPKTLHQATALLRKHGSDAKVLAGGMSLIPIMKLRLASPTFIVDINRVSGMEYIRRERNKLLIGALTRHHAIETSEDVRSHAGLLAETASWIGDPQVRNRGSMGGSLVHCDPSGDWGAAALAIRANMVITGPRGPRTVGSDDFFVDTFVSAVGPSEILTEIMVPIPKARSGWAYAKLERRAGDFATVGVAAQLSIDDKGVCKYAGIGLTAVGPVNLRAKKAEGVLLGNRVTTALIEKAAAAAREESRPESDPLRGSVEYKKEMTRVFTRRALTKAVARARGEA